MDNRTAKNPLNTPKNKYKIPILLWFVVKIQLLQKFNINELCIALYYTHNYTNRQYKKYRNSLLFNRKLKLKIPNKIFINYKDKWSDK